MARSRRYYQPGLIWHITHRCHKKEFSLKFNKDKKKWLQWLFQAKKRYGLCILNYAITSNHIHLLVRDNGRKDAISKSMDLVQGRTAQAYNKRKGLSGSFWEDRYNPTAVESGSHLFNCMAYIDFNMVRAGAVAHPEDWPYCGYHEIIGSRQRCTLIDYETLASLLNLKSRDELKKAYKKWIDLSSGTQFTERQSKWTESMVVGSERFVTQFEKRLERRSERRKIVGSKDCFELKDDPAAYSCVFAP